MTLCLVMATTAMAAEVVVKGRVIPEYHEFNPASPFAPGAGQSSFGKSRSREEVELRATALDVNLVATAVAKEQARTSPENRLVLNELYDDFSLAGERFSIGKKILSWDVGFGFRPLDLLQQENRRSLVTTTLEGVTNLAWEKFSGDHAWLLVCANPGEGRASSPKNDESLAMKYYLRDNGIDWHGVMRLSQRNRLEGGAAFSSVPRDSLEWHGSLLYQGRYEQQYNGLIGKTGVPLSTADPMVLRVKEHGIKGVAGFTLTGESGFSLLGEGWYDGSAYTAADWRGVKGLVERQAALTGHGVPDSAVNGNIAYSLRYFDRPNLLRENILLRLSHRQEGENWEPALDLLCTPADGGLVATASASYLGNHFRLESGIRQYGGLRGAAYRMLPEERIIYFALQGFW